MKPGTDDDLREIFAHARCCEREDAPAWRPELLERPVRRERATVRWIPAALAVACVAVAAVFFAAAPQREARLSEALPPLLESPPGELFAGVETPLLTFEAPSDFLLNPQLNRSIP
ncbi:hypothetical protein [Prosthecobacter sp.]|uniref:hypothetical protein n=1 Tax=Prosthecobacter sp. TaxID=1965333 RepID=UPI00378414E8